ncbi:MAG TPA: amino acid ABC transporter substrate-binding protein [Xanthobacteraceae bacterium]|jgi:branched-chain amino acid transport system substrate-binding protein
MLSMPGIARVSRACGALLAGMLCGLAAAGAYAAEPVKVGFSMALTGGVASAGKQLLAALEIWRDDVNAKGGLLNRPLELVYYDDQSNPSTVPGIYTKLISVDKVDALLGPYATNMVAPAMPIIMQNDRTTISMLAIGINNHFRYPRYFSMVAVGPRGPGAFSDGFFALALEQNPRPQTVTIVAADAEFAKTAADGARENAKAAGLRIIHDKSYPPGTTDFAPVVRAVQAANADIVYVAAYPPDTVGIVRAAAEIGLSPKMFGGAMIGLLVTPIKVQLGPLSNGLIIGENFVPALRASFPGAAELLQRYQAKAAALGTDALGTNFVPFGYAAGQVLAESIRGTSGFDDNRRAEYMRTHAFQTVVGEVTFGSDGEWARSRMYFTQFQNVAGNDVEQFRDGSRQVILWPRESKTGEIIYPYGKAKAQ